MDALFTFVNLLPLPIWLSMMLFPKTRFTQRMVLSPWPLIALGAVYLVLLLAAIGSGLSSGGSGAGFSLSLDAFQSAFTSDLGFLAGWSHYLMLDLFAGIWLFRDAKYWGHQPTLFLLLTLLFAPVGLASYLLWRKGKERNDPVKLLN